MGCNFLKKTGAALDFMQQRTFLFQWFTQSRFRTKDRFSGGCGTAALCVYEGGLLHAGLNCILD
jgi:hypothetical protein